MTFIMPSIVQGQVQHRSVNCVIPYSGKLLRELNFRALVGREHFTEKTFAEC